MTDNSPAIPAKWLLKLFTRINVFVYRLSGGRLLNEFSGMPICLVEMTGAKSGKKRTIPLMYVPHDSGIVLVASQGGAPKNPVWYNNLVANPEVRITEGGVTKDLTAREVNDTEKAILWPTCVKFYPPYQDYQKRTSRNIPVFLCT
ncbi:MAG: nitroreductase family deazaflavin-dependent oxidoreductase [Pseudomonadales bacterium]|nr:nitroreductase family deazaflavin-dependent oxidoreductase [Pseudomonadales bacterium]